MYLCRKNNKNKKKTMLTVANPIYDSVFKYMMEHPDTDLYNILNFVLAATSDAKLRQDMNVEEEYYSAIENRDTAIMMRDKKIKEQDSMIAEQSNQLAEKDNLLAEQKKALMASVKILQTSGFSVEKIAESLNLSISDVREMLE